MNGLATVWLLLYGINAYWLTFRHRPKSLKYKARRSRRSLGTGTPTANAKQNAHSNISSHLAYSAAPGNTQVTKFPALVSGELDSELKHEFNTDFGSEMQGTNGYISASFAPLPDHTDYPVVTIQLPIFNERYVAERLLDAVCCLDYPRDRLYIQVLDDSTDDTQEILQTAVQAYRRQGIWVDHIHRTDRKGFKAGALQDAMPQVQGDYIAIFDADFLPSADWLKRTIIHYCKPDLHPHPERIAVVQTRWGHVNSEYSLLTKLQAAGIDGHFAIEQQTRYQQGYLLNFNGTAGIWKRQAIMDAGGWQADTLAEDMDLSYRAQLKGWKVVYDNDIVATAELPVAIAAFKLQQFRWAKGSIQCAKKLLLAVWQSKRGWGTKWQATLHLTGYAAHPLMLIVILLSVPLLLLTSTQAIPQAHAVSNLWGILMLPATFGPPYLYLTAQHDLYPQTWTKRIGRVLLLAMLGTGISLSNTKAVIAGLFNTGANFRRTPKFNIQKSGDRWQDKGYHLPLDWTAVLEICLCAYSAVAVYLCVQQGIYITLPFMLLYMLGYGYVGGLTLWQAWQQR